jgi:hypothetical protein
MANPQNIPPEVADALARGNLIEAIKVLRQQKNLGLAEAKGLIETLQKQGNVKVNVTTTVRTVKKSPPGTVIEQHPGLSPGEVPRGNPARTLGVIVVLVVIAIGIAIYLGIA